MNVESMESAKRKKKSMKHRDAQVKSENGQGVLACAGVRCHVRKKSWEQKSGLHPGLAV